MPLFHSNFKRVVQIFKKELTDDSLTQSSHSFLFVSFRTCHLNLTMTSRIIIRYFTFLTSIHRMYARLASPSVFPTSVNPSLCSPAYQTTKVRIGTEIALKSLLVLLIMTTATSGLNLRQPKSGFNSKQIRGVGLRNPIPIGPSSGLTVCRIR